MDDIKNITEQAFNNLNRTNSIQELESFRIEYLGKNGLITGLLKKISTMSVEDKKSFGSLINQIKIDLTSKIDEKKGLFELQEIEARLCNEAIDIDLPIREENKGSIHPISQVIEELIAIFGVMGFNFVDGPEIEDDYHNFTALNIPENHPARQMQDTFYLSNEKLLRTQTSSVQIRHMESNTPPIRIISAGKTYRCESDMTHTPMFHQIEGLVIEENIHMGHLKYCIEEFLKKFFKVENLPIRFRPSFFPFTEPSAEIDIGCIRENGEINIGKGKDFLEIMGCGMVHPNVLKNVGIDPSIYQGFAFGAGIERLTMLKYGITDLRNLYEGDIRWLKHYNFSSYSLSSILGRL